MVCLDAVWLPAIPIVAIEIEIAIGIATIRNANAKICFVVHDQQLQIHLQLFGCMMQKEV